MDDFPIYPPVKKTLSICKFKYQIVEIKLKESIRIAVYLFSDTDTLVESKQYLIQGTEYANWGTDDNYIVNLIKTKVQSGL
jgi:hypothetical protein